MYRQHYLAARRELRTHFRRRVGRCAADDMDIDVVTNGGVVLKIDWTHDGSLGGDVKFLAKVGAPLHQGNCQSKNDRC